MSLTVPQNIEDEINAAHTAVIDLFEIDFGGGVDNIRYWSNQRVPSHWYAGVTFLEGATPTSFEPRIISAGPRLWALDGEQSSTRLVVANVVQGNSESLNDITREYGIDVFEGAKLHHHRLFPNVKGVYQDYWIGTGMTPTFEEDFMTWEIEFGPANLRRRFGRILQVTCPSIFAGGAKSDCPYDTVNAIGVPDQSKGLIFAATTGTNNTNIFKASGGFNAIVTTNFVAYNRTNNCFAPVTGIVSDTQVSIGAITAGDGGTAAFASGHDIVLAPPFTECPKTVPACKLRAMFGQFQENNGAADKRRYFAGNAESVEISFSGRIPKGSANEGDRFTRSSSGNETLDGTIIPVVVGFARLRDIPSIAHAPAGDFQHGLFILCEGEIVDVRQPIVNQKPPDSGDVNPNSSVAVSITDSSFIKYGTWAPSGLEDARATTDGIAQQIRRAVGRRKSFSVDHNREYDTYGAGIANTGEVFGGILGGGDTRQAGNPYLFNSAFGDGVSLHGLAAIRVRIETNQDNTETLVAQADIHGLMIKLPSTRTSGGDKNLTVGPTTFRYVTLPNIADFAFGYATDPRWGMGLTEDQVDLPSVDAASTFCDGQVGSVQSDFTEIHGTVGIGAVDVSVVSGPVGPRHIVTFDIPQSVGNLAGRKILFHAPGRQFATVIAGSIAIEDIDEDPIIGIEPDIGRIDPRRRDSQSRGMIILLRDEFPSGKQAQLGDTFTIDARRQVRRWTANGRLAENISAAEALKMILFHAGMNYRMSTEGKIEFVVRRRLTPSELDAVVTNRYFTDRGTQRNITRDNSGKSSLKIFQKPPTEIANEYSVKFEDRNRDFRISEVAVFSESAQIRAAALSGEEGDRKVLDEQIQLPLTTSVDEAARRSALHAREHFVQNLFCEFQTSLKTAMMVQPGDIITVDSNLFGLFITPNDGEVTTETGALFFRVLKKQETDKYVISFTCQVHLNPIYNDSATAFQDFFITTGGGIRRGNLPANVIPEVAAEEIEVAEGVVRDFIRVKITYPDIRLDQPD